jgi:hypothetical protein
MDERDALDAKMELLDAKEQQLSTWLMYIAV